MSHRPVLPDRPLATRYESSLYIQRPMASYHDTLAMASRYDGFRDRRYDTRDGRSRGSSRRYYRYGPTRKYEEDQYEKSIFDPAEERPRYEPVSENDCPICYGKGDKKQCHYVCMSCVKRMTNFQCAVCRKRMKLTAWTTRIITRNKQREENDRILEDMRVAREIARMFG